MIKELIMKNDDFLETITKSFMAYVEAGTSRSTAKLKALHGKIAADVRTELGCEYVVKSQNEGYSEGDGKEGALKGHYYDKNVDIAIEKNGTSVAGYAVKFVVRNYSQNSNNYFENMLGETANIRANSIPYFQIFIILNPIPYFKRGGSFGHYEKVSEHNFDKYFIMSKDCPRQFFHVPDKTLLIVVDSKEMLPESFDTEGDYFDYYKKRKEESFLFGYSNVFKDVFNKSDYSNTIYNDYHSFISKTCHLIKGL